VKDLSISSRVKARLDVDSSLKFAGKKDFFALSGPPCDHHQRFFRRFTPSSIRANYPAHSHDEERNPHHPTSSDEEARKGEGGYDHAKRPQGCEGKPMSHGPGGGEERGCEKRKPRGAIFFPPRPECRNGWGAGVGFPVFGGSYPLVKFNPARVGSSPPIGWIEPLVGRPSRSMESTFHDASETGGLDKYGGQRNECRQQGPQKTSESVGAGEVVVHRKIQRT